MSLALGMARYVVVDDGVTVGIVPFTIVDAHLLIPRGSRVAIALEDFLDVLAGVREPPLRSPVDFAGRAAGGASAADDTLGHSGPIPWRRFLAAVRGLGQEIERERPFERGLQYALESPVRLKGLRDHLEAARSHGRLTDADLLYALYELSRELSRLRDDEDEPAGRELIQKGMHRSRRAPWRAHGRGSTSGRRPDADTREERSFAMNNGFATAFDHAATDPNVDAAVIQTQLATAAALRRRMDARGGAILGDEVGAGKTFVSFALIAELLLREPRRGVVIFVPNRLLVSKWERQLRDYLIASILDKRVGHDLADRIHPMDRALSSAKNNAIVITTHSVYSYRTSAEDQRACLRAALEILPEGRGRHHKAAFKAFGLGQHSGNLWPSWAQPSALTTTTLKPLAPLLQRYGDGERGHRLGADMRTAVMDVRRLVGRRALPDAGLVIIDEAHNLKSTSSAIYRSLMGVLNQSFDALLFLTATPFQLGRHELLTIVDFFRASRMYERNPAAFADQRQALSDAMDAHVDALKRFGAAWRDLSRGQIAPARAAIAGDAPVQFDPLTAEVEAAFRASAAAKVALERAMRPFVVRSIRDRDHHETGCVDQRFVTQQVRVPLALVDRLLAEIMREGRTFISSALIGACSSWPALLDAAIMRDAGRSPSTTRDALRELGRRGLLGGHPKVEQTVAAVIDAVGRGEKTLVFVERERTGDELRRRVEAELENAEGPGSQLRRGAAAGIASQDALRLAVAPRKLPQHDLSGHVRPRTAGSGHRPRVDRCRCAAALGAV